MFYRKTLGRFRTKQLHLLQRCKKKIKHWKLREWLKLVLSIDIPLYLEYHNLIHHHHIHHMHHVQHPLQLRHYNLNKIKILNHGILTFKRIKGGKGPNEQPFFCRALNTQAIQFFGGILCWGAARP